MFYTAEIDMHGRLTIPAPLRKKLDLHKGSKITLTEKEGVVELLTSAEKIQKAQELFGYWFEKSSKNLSEELIKERRKEAERE